DLVEGLAALQTWELNKRWEFFMKEQEQYKKLLNKMIHETESLKFQSSEELVQALVKELAQFNPLANTANNIQTNSIIKKMKRKSVKLHFCGGSVVFLRVLTSIDV